MFLLLLLSTIFVRQGWVTEPPHTIVPLGKDWILEVPFTSWTLLMLGYLLITLVSFQGMEGIADWLLSIFFGIPYYPSSHVLQVRHGNKIVYSLESSTVFFCGCWVVTWLKSFSSVALYLLVQWCWQRYRHIIEYVHIDEDTWEDSLRPSEKIRETELHFSYIQEDEFHPHKRNDDTKIEGEDVD